MFDQLKKGLVIVYFAFLFLLVGTGGFITKSKLEFSSVEPWALIYGFLILVRLFFFRGPSWSWQLWKKAVSVILQSTQKVWFFFVTVAALCFVAHLVRHYSFHTHLFDVGFIHQPLFVGYCNACKNNTALGEHLLFTLFGIMPFTELLRPFFLRDAMVFFFQVVLVVASVWTFKRYYREESVSPSVKGAEGDAVSSIDWGCLLLLLVSSKAFRAGLIWDFREDVLLFVFLLMGLLFWQKRKLSLSFSFLVLALLTKEHVALFLPFLAPALWYDLKSNLQSDLMQPPERPISRDTSKVARRSVVFIVGLISVCVVYAGVGFKVLMPYYMAGAEQTSEVVKRFSAFGKTPVEILLHAVTQPQLVFDLLSERFLTLSAIKYLFLLFLPWCVLLAMANLSQERKKVALWGLPALIIAFMNLASNADTQRSLAFHYEWALFPFLIVMAAKSSQNLKNSQKIRVWAIVLFLALATSGRWPGFTITHVWPTQKQVTEAVYLEKLPKDLRIVSSFSVLAHLSHLSQVERERDSEALIHQMQNGMLWLYDSSGSSVSPDAVKLKLLENQKGLDGSLGVHLDRLFSIAGEEEVPSRFQWYRLTGTGI